MSELRNKSNTCESGHILYPSTTWPHRYPATVDAIIICNRCKTSEIGRAGKLSYTSNSEGFYHCNYCSEDICPSCAIRNDFSLSQFSIDPMSHTKKFLIIHVDIFNYIS